MMLLQKFHIHSGLAVKTLRPRGGNHIDQVLIAELIFTQQNQMAAFGIQFAHLVKTGTLGHIDLTANYRADPRFLASL